MTNNALVQPCFQAFESISSPNLWTPAYLSANDCDTLYQQALAQVEVAVTNCWLNLLAMPNDGGRLAAYREAKASVERLSADWDRLKASRGG